ncbi:MAG: N-acetylmuramoyl-L-alanine amidase [Phycisphaerae bacterium]
MLEAGQFRIWQPLVLLVALVAAGCAPANNLQHNGSLVPSPPGAISVYQMAGRLGMAVMESTPSMATLRSAGNTVVIYADPAGQAYVNGRALSDPTGGIVLIDGVLFVPMSFEQAIRSALRGGTTPPPSTPSAPGPRSPLVKVPMRGGLVVIDAGHGGKDTGAPSVAGGVEKTIVLDVARAVSERLAQSGVDVKMTREGDTFVELDERAAIANRARADLFVSIHADSAPRNRSANGFTVYVSRSPSRASEAAAAAIARRMSAAGAEFRGKKEAGYRVLVCNDRPAVLVELGFLTNGRDAANLSSGAYRDRLADAIADGIVDYLQNN